MRAVTLLALILAGCASTRGDNPPTEVWRYPGNYKTMAICLYATQEEKASGYRVFFFDYEGMNRARVWIEGLTILSTTTGAVGFEVRFLQDGDEVIAEYWTRFTAKRWEGVVKADLDQCAGSV